MRLPAQISGLLLLNAWFLKAWGRNLCLPVLQCHGCPAAATACPIGTLSYFAVLKRFPYYLAGLMGMLGLTLGRAFCGWACPFGLCQDAAYRIPSRKWTMPRRLNYVKYAVLIILVIAIPLMLSSGEKEVFSERMNESSYDFCALVCPMGTAQAGLLNPEAHPRLFKDWSKEEEEAPEEDELQVPGMSSISAAGATAEATRELAAALRRPALTLGGISWRTWNKLVILFVAVVFAIAVRRSFCRVLCPVGAIMAVTSHLSLLRLRTDRAKCTRCMRCVGVCPTACRHVPAAEGEREATAECLLCLDCVRNCPEAGALSATFAGRQIMTSRRRT